VKVLALDPGGTTGWAIFDISVDDEGSPVWRKAIRDHFRAGEMGSNREHHKALWSFLIKEHPDLIICERFDNRNNEFAKIVSREYIGIVKLFCLLFHSDLVMQGSDVMVFTDDDKLTKLGIKVTPRSKWEHANDALRHLVRHLCVNGLKNLTTVKFVLLEALRTRS
jgi:hypothetical protein